MITAALAIKPMPILKCVEIPTHVPKHFKLSQTQKVVEDHDSDEAVDKNIYVQFAKLLMMKCCILLEFNGKCLNPGSLQQNPCHAFTKLL